MDIITALKTEAARLEGQLGRVRAAIVALNGSTMNGTRKGAVRGRKAGTSGTWHHSEATRRKLSLAQKKIWAAKHKRK
jgi:hypothetical protein